MCVIGSLAKHVLKCTNSRVKLSCICWEHVGYLAPNVLIVILYIISLKLVTRGRKFRKSSCSWPVCAICVGIHLQLLGCCHTDILPCWWNFLLDTSTFLYIWDHFFLDPFLSYYICSLLLALFPLGAFLDGLCVLGGSVTVYHSQWWRIPSYACVMIVRKGGGIFGGFPIHGLVSFVYIFMPNCRLHDFVE